MKKLVYIMLLLLLVNQVAEAKKIKKSKNKLQINTKEQWPNWVDDIFDWFASLWQPVWGKYSEGGSTNRNIPLLTSDRKNQDINTKYENK